MAEALRIVSVERGHDARGFSLVAFGGAGPVHAAALAEELQIPEVIVPPVPGAFSALGLVASDLKRDYVRTLYADLGTVDPARVAETFGVMEASGTAMLDAARVPAERRALLRQADLRYRRQAYELTVPLADGPVTRASLDAAMAAFHAKHELTYGHANPAEPVQLVNLRLTAVGRLPSLTLAQPGDPSASRTRERDVWFAAHRLHADAGALAPRPRSRPHRSPGRRSSRRWIPRPSSRPAGSLPSTPWASSA